MFLKALLIFIFIHSHNSLASTCTITLISAKSKSINLENCEPKGVLYKVGNTLKGQYVLDMRKLKSPMEDLNRDIFDYFYRKNRYATFDLYPYRIGEKHIKTWIKLNGVVKITKGKILSSSNNKIEADYYLSLSDFKMKRKIPWSMFENVMKIKLRIERNAP